MWAACTGREAGAGAKHTWVEAAWATQSIQGWAGEAILRVGHIQGVHGVRQHRVHAVHGARQQSVQGTYGWAGILSCHPVVRFRVKAQLALGRGGNGMECC